MAAQEYSPRQVAELLRVSTRTVLRWFDSGRLPGYRCPMSQRRRIPHADLLSFLKQHNLPVPALLEAGARDALSAGQVGAKPRPG
jgi:excisionase family DNA binding protein